MLASRNMNIHIIGGKAMHDVVKDFVESRDNRVFVNGSFLGKGNIKETDILFVNNHIDDNRMKTKREYIKKYSHIQTGEVSSSLYNGMKNFVNVMRQKNGSLSENSFLKSVGCPFKFAKQPRCGHKAILHFLRNGCFPVVEGFSFSIHDSPDTYYNQVGVRNFFYHNYDSEVFVLRWLHDNNKIDLTPCMFVKLENNTPLIDATGLQPRTQFLGYCLDAHNECKITNCRNPQQVIDELCRNYKNVSVERNKDTLHFKLPT